MSIHFRANGGLIRIPDAHTHTYLIIVGFKRLQTLLHDMIAIGILDELQEPWAQSIDDKTNLFPCPEALNQLLNCPCPEMAITGFNKNTDQQESPKSKKIHISTKKHKKVKIDRYTHGR